MIIPLDKLLTYDDNRYILTKAMMKAVDRINNVKNYPEENINWKVVPNIIKLMIDDKIKFVYDPNEMQERDQ